MDEHRQEISEIKEVTGVVDDLITMMSRGNIDFLELSFGSLHLSLHANSDRGTTTTQHAPARPVQALSSVSEPDSGDSAEGHVITAPMIGTFYIAPAPNEPPFVTPGDDIVEGQTIGIVEAMKIMNEIAADRSGKVVEIIAGDGETVEYGSPLIRIEPAGE